MNKTTSLSLNMVAKSKNKVLSCSTPEHRADSPSRDSDSLCDSEAGSPVPFLCTQDGVEGDTDVVWNYYTPKAENNAHYKLKNSTPLSRKTKKSIKPKLIEKHVPKRRPIRLPNKKTELFQELMELNQKLPELLAKKTQNNVNDNGQLGSEEDVFSESPEYSPRSGLRNSSRCLRKNVLSSKFTKPPEAETALESDDSMNECLLKASQIVEEKFVNCAPNTDKRNCPDKSHNTNIKDLKTNIEFQMDHDSMDSILKTVLESPLISKAKRLESPKLGNDSFDSFVGNLNDSALEQLTQMPIKNNMSIKKVKSHHKDSSPWMLKELVVHDSSPSKSPLFGRYSSMPESPLVADDHKPSTSGMVFGRYSSMPYDKNSENITALEDSPIRCTPEEINKKHQMAREKLLAKRQLPFTSSQHSTQTLPHKFTQVKNAKFQPRIPSSASSKSLQSNTTNNSISPVKLDDKTLDMKSLIEKKRQEALMKLRRRQPK